MPDATHPFHCSICKKPIPFLGGYYACSVSTCNRKRLALYFCSVPCFDAHLPEARHRDAWAEERRAPSAEEWARERGDDAEPEDEDEDEDARTTTPSAEPAAVNRRVVAPAASAEAAPRDVLVVVSKLKSYVKARSGMNTSDAVAAVLSDRLRSLCDEAIKSATRAGRKTLLDRDFEST